ncbi:MAG: family 20 glycosylhydrolase [Neisseria sp.]|uniref:family 20 glycosylhydrolase n=1 Tax=Neisseria sp. TaxID=192066 RepID=UPI0026DDAC72|nr:family 20 glycosylhydrolase [Neisseria sp.]MDO4640320.1 family 20 glycosylhydrolase [Neisseria sp.]
MFSLLLMLAVSQTACFSQASSNPEQILENAAGKTAAPKEGGLMLDTARHFYPVPVIKDFIDTLSHSGGSFLHLHFSDNENYALESRILNQRAEDARVNEEGLYVNPVTDKPFLSFAQLDEIKAYAKARNIELIPELDSPSHMDAIFALLANARGKSYVNSLKSKGSDDEINVNKPESIAFVKSLIGEVADAFGDGSRHFHIGGDEFGYDVESNHEFIRYANSLAGFLKARKLTPRMWNDGVIKATVDKLDHDIQITYWSYDGDTENKQDAKTRRNIRASLPDLLAKGFGVLNYNSYYLYITPQQNWRTSHDSDFAMRDVENRWNLGVWDGENKANAVKDPSKILGAALSIWGENAGSMSSQTIQKYTSGLLESVIKKTHAQTDKK